MTRRLNAAAWLVLAFAAYAAEPVLPETTDDKAQPPQQEAKRLIPADSSWALRLPAETQVAYHGVVDADPAGVPQHGMVYGPNVVGFFAGIITHGVIVGSAQERQRKQAQDAADRVLLPFETVIRDYTSRALLEHALEKLETADRKKLVEPTLDPGAYWLVDSLPVFLMTQDRRALIVENTLTIFRPGSASKATYRNTIKVVSDARDASDLIPFWSDNNGEKLKDESASLLARSLEIAMRGAVDTAGKGTGVHRTFHYREGDKQKMERGELVNETCRRIVLRNLRGWIMSVPAAAKPEPPNTCGEETRPSS